MDQNKHIIEKINVFFSCVEKFSHISLHEKHKLKLVHVENGKEIICFPLSNTKILNNSANIDLSMPGDHQLARSILF